MTRYKRIKKSSKKNLTGSKVLMPVFLTFTVGTALVGCASVEQGQSTTEEVHEIQPQSIYTISPEVANTELIMNNLATAPHWFPAELLEWTPSSDKHFEYNRSTVALADRVSKDRLETVNATQDKEREVVAISIMNNSTSGNPSQGSNKISSNVFSYWQYVDKMVYWGGSSGEGLIVPPTADVTNAAHKNGVPVLGTVFFPMEAHGGKMAWLDEFLTKDENGSFPIVDKLIEVAQSYGFDGWFINQETEGNEETPLTPEHAQLMKELIVEFKAKAGDSLEIMWYDSMTKEGEMDWQNALTEENEFFLVGDNQEMIADSMFLNFWWTTDTLAPENLLEASTQKAQELGINPNVIYAGIDVQANGVNTPIRWELFEAGNTSLGLYCPSWTYASASSIDDFHAKENRLWVNENGDPSVSTSATDREWRGVSTYIVEKSVVNSLPFMTNFNLGHGYNFFIDGEKVSETDWNNRSMADVLPTYRWMIENEGANTLSADIDYANAFYGGNSIKLLGNMEAGKKSTIKLFSADLTLEDKVSFTTAIKSSENVDFDLVLDFHDGTTETLKSKEKVSVDEWTTLSYDVSKLSGKAIKNISYAISSKEEVSGLRLSIGNMTIARESDATNATASNLKVEDYLFDEDAMYAGVKLSWEGNADSNGHYEIYQINQDGTKSFLGTSATTAFFYNALPREGESNQTNFEVVAVNNLGEQGTSAKATMEWPDNSMPKAEFSVSRTLVAPGDDVTFTNLSSQNAEEFVWEFKGANIESSTDVTPTINFAEEGVYTVTLTAKNKSGEVSVTKEEIITVSNAATELVNLSEGKATEASGFVNNNEAPQFAVDGLLDTKWCATGTAPHWIVIDLGELKTISEVYMAHAEAGGESDGMNTKAYTIEVSQDGENFEEVVNITRNSAATTVDTFKAVEAQYVRVSAIKPTQNSDSAVRIYEIQVRGLE